MGGVLVRDEIHDAFMTGPEHIIELFHGYTYSAHPLAVAAGLATLDLYREEDLFERAHALEDKWADAAMSLKGKPNVTDIRTIGLVAGIDLDPVAGTPGKRAYDAMERGFHDHGIMLRITGDTIALSPPLIITESEIDEIFSDKLPKVLKAVA
jgi:beta-alanine--pyruvate transaminase